jgi:hypothetical protein
MAGPWHPRRAGVASRGHILASDADREHVLEALKSAFVYGLLSRDDLYTRAGRVLASRTYAELTALTADIPAGLIAAQSPAVTQSSRRLVSKKVVVWAACLLVLGPAVGAAFLTFYGGFVVMFMFALIGATVTAAPHREGI